jgi:hypothetical protein
MILWLIEKILLIMGDLMRSGSLLRMEDFIVDGVLRISGTACLLL